MTRLDRSVGSIALAIISLVLCQTSKLGLPWQFHQGNQGIQCIITLKLQCDRALGSDYPEEENAYETPATSRTDDGPCDSQQHPYAPVRGDCI